MIVTIRFDRIGRNHNVADLNVEISRTIAEKGEYVADHLAAEIHAYARKFLISNEYVTQVDLTHMRGSIGRFGDFEVLVPNTMYARALMRAWGVP